MSHKDKMVTYEVKTDLLVGSTGNLIIEFKDKGKPSGISTTTADYWTLYSPQMERVWNIKTNDLKTTQLFAFENQKRDENMIVVDNIEKFCEERERLLTF